MEKLKILNNALLTDGSAFEKLSTVADEESEYESFDVSHGHGRLIRVGVTVQKGVKATAEVNIIFTSYKRSSYTAVTDEMRNHMDQNIVEHLDECEHKENYSDWWLWFHSNSQSDYDHHKEQTKETITNTDEKKIHALDDNFSHEAQQYKVSGKFEVEGLSMIPTTAYLFVEMLQITTKSGNSMNVINSTATAADENGDPSNVKISGDSTLNILPL